MAKINTIHPDNPQENLILEAVKCLKAGGIIIYPSDTVYTMGCDINNLKAMERLAKIKGTKLEKSQFSIICNNLSHLSAYTKPLENSIFRTLKTHIPGPFTFILDAGKQLPAAYKGKKTVGIRVPDSAIPQLLVQHLGNPIVSTSIRDEDEILEYSTDPGLIAEKYDNLVDLVIDGGSGGNTASTIIDFTTGEAVILRQGKGIF